AGVAVRGGDAEDEAVAGGEGVGGEVGAAYCVAGGGGGWAGGTALLSAPRCLPHFRLLPHSRLRSSGGTPMSGGTPIARPCRPWGYLPGPQGSGGGTIARSSGRTDPRGQVRQGF